LRTKPKLKYCGLTVILSNPSRFDKVSLLCGSGGVLFNQLLQPHYNVMQCDIRDLDCKDDFVEGTKCILLLGEKAMHTFLPESNGNTLNEMRGSPFYYSNIPTICSFLPQDAADIKNWEKDLNKQAAQEEDESEDDEGGDEKSLSKTKRANYAFFLGRDILKCKNQLMHADRGSKWPSDIPVNYHIFPPSQTIIDILTNTKGKYMGFDIETDYEEQNLLCFSFSFFDSSTQTVEVYSVPTINNDYKPAYSAIPYIIKALSIAFQNNTVVAHNGSGFDFLVMCYKYSLPIRQIEDTMVMHHRCFPEIEQSLGHCVSLYTHQPFHKDSDSRAYFTHQHMMDKLKYCAKDVYTLVLIHKEITRYAKTIPGLTESIACANRSLYSYLVCSLTGIRYKEEKVKEMIEVNDKLMMQYLKMIEILIGPTSWLEIKKAVKGKAKAFAGSNTQCCKYFHDMLGYVVLRTSPKTGKPSLAKQLIFKLALKYPDNPVLRLVIMYRETQKETSSLKFIPWKDDNNKIINYTKYATGQIY
jgi:hypothetical protein